jgi:hypothetical protein
MIMRLIEGNDVTKLHPSSPMLQQNKLTKANTLAYFAATSVMMDIAS